MKGYLANIEKITLKNKYFRQVLFTSQNLQLVVMALKPGEEIGLEIHDKVDQFFRVETGKGRVIIEGKSKAIAAGDAFIVPQGLHHNVINTSKNKRLQLYTLYSPPNHRDGVIHKIKQEAEADQTDIPPK
jgi:mannose-6-phosphate isomerase-like protein (cupin superfamily)